MSGIELQHNGVQLVREIDKSNINKAFLGNSSTNGAINIVLEYNYKFSLKPNFEIASLRKDSPAALVGLRSGDVIMKVNGKPSHNFTLQELTSMFYVDEGRKIVLEVERDGFLMEFQFFLKRIL
jgi:C-terminal processing protease CtpA/Prc